MTPVTCSKKESCGCPFDAQEDIVSRGPFGARVKIGGNSLPQQASSSFLIITTTHRESWADRAKEPIVPILLPRQLIKKSISTNSATSQAYVSLKPLCKDSALVGNSLFRPSEKPEHIPFDYLQIFLSIMQSMHEVRSQYGFDLYRTLRTATQT